MLLERSKDFGWRGKARFGENRPVCNRRAAPRLGYHLLTA